MGDYSDDKRAETPDHSPGKQIANNSKQIPDTRKVKMLDYLHRTIVVGNQSQDVKRSKAHVRQDFGPTHVLLLDDKDILLAPSRVGRGIQNVYFSTL